MRIILFLAITFSFASVKSQTVLPLELPSYSQTANSLNNVPVHDSVPKSKWFFSSYRGISTGVTFFNRGNAAFVAAPMGLQLNRRLNNNLYAFANVAVAPAFTSFNPTLLNSGINKPYGYNGYNMLRPNSFGINPSVSLGLMYVNDAKTFSISGSISAERISYPLVPYYPVNNTTQSQVIPAKGK